MTFRKKIRQRKKAQKVWSLVLDIVFDQIEDRKMSYHEVADKAGIHISTVYRYSRREFTYMHTDTVTKLMYALDIGFDNLAECGINIEL